jgi:hypothetical protein
MIEHHFEIEQIAPWLISGASGCYVVVRARQLSRANASKSTWFRFLAKQSDMLLALCGCPAIWHVARRRAKVRPPNHNAGGDRQNLTASAVHELRQVFTVLLLGLGMVARRANDGKTAALARRLQRVTRFGASLLNAMDAPTAADRRMFSLAQQSAHTQLEDGNG